MVCDNSGVQWFAEYDHNGTAATRYINPQTGATGTPTFPLFDCGVKRATITYNGNFQVVTAPATLTFAAGAITSFSVTAYIGNTSVSGTAFATAQVLPEGATAGVSAPESGDGRHYVLPAITFTPATGATCIVSVTPIAP